MLGVVEATIATLTSRASTSNMADTGKRESGRQKEQGKRRVLDEASRQRRIRKALDALEQDNFQDDPHADLKMSKKAPKFDESMETVKKKRRGKGETGRYRLRKNFSALVEEEQLTKPDGPSFMTAAVPAPTYPPRHLCAVCGFPSNYICVTCGARYCCVRCLGTHQDTRCMKWTA